MLPSAANPMVPCRTLLQCLSCFVTHNPVSLPVPSTPPPLPNAATATVSTPPPHHPTPPSPPLLARSICPSLTVPPPPHNVALHTQATFPSPSDPLTLPQPPDLVLLVCAWQEAGDVHKGDEGDVEGVTEANEPASYIDTYRTWQEGRNSSSSSSVVWSRRLEKSCHSATSGSACAHHW
jgi:hypothetical protein